MFNLFSKPMNVGAVKFVVACLGNPGLQYEHTRHNAGFLCAEYMSQKHGFDIKNAKFSSLCGEVFFGENKALVIKPQTYMNLSGRAVREALQFYKIDPSTGLLVIYDDVYIPCGKLRIRTKGTDGGHNGIKSIIAELGSDNFARIRVGVGAVPQGYKMSDWVLGKITETEQVFEAIEKASEATEMIVGGKLSLAMNKYSG